MCHNPDTFFCFYKKRKLKSLTNIVSPSKNMSSRCKRVFTKCLFRFTCPQCPAVCQVDLTSPHITFLASIFTPFQPSNNLPQTMAVNAKEADKEKQGPIYQHRSDSSSFIGDKKRTGVHLSFAETGKTGIRAPRSPLDHSLSKKSQKVALCQELSRAAKLGPKHPLWPISHLVAISGKRRCRIIARH